MYDIWNYRVELPKETKKLICPQHNGDPFKNIPIHYIHNKSKNIETCVLLTYVYTVVNKIVHVRASHENQYLGSIYILTALTLVNEDAALSMPWLYSTVI